MPLARRAEITLIYDGVDISRDIAPFLTSMTYTDNSHGKSDDLQVALMDKEGLWRDPWFPDKGATLTAEIRTLNWFKDGETRRLPCGTFQIDEITSKGPPTTADIKAVSVPVRSSARQEERTQGWEDIKLSKVAAEIAARQGLEFFWDSQEDPLWDRRDQAENADLSFLMGQCERVGLALKVTDTKLVVFNEEEYEQRGVVDTITFSQVASKRVASYSFRTKCAGIFKGSRLQYHDSVQDSTFDVYVPAENQNHNGQTLNVNERVKSLGEAEQIAKKRLYQANKHEVTGSITMIGNMAMIGGSMIGISGFGKFDGKYFIEKAVHKYTKGGGYTTQIDIRKGGTGGSGAVQENFPVYGGDDGDE
jgi:Phage protein D